MSRPNLKLATGEPPPRSPERVELASVIERHSAALAVRDRVRAAQERAADQLYREGGAIDTARKTKAAVEEARASEVHHLAAAFIDGATAEPSLMEAATAAAEAADAELARVRRTIAALEQEAADAERDLGFVAMAVDAAVRDVVRADPAIRKLAGDHAAADRHYNDLHRAMETMQNFLPDDLKFWHGTGRWPDLAAAATWSAAITALASDADAPLPS